MRTQRVIFAVALSVAALSGACNRPDSPPPPVMPQPPAAPPQAVAPAPPPVPKELPLPDPKQAPAPAKPDAPASAATAPAPAPEPPITPSPTQKPDAPTPPLAAKPKRGAKTRDIHPQSGAAGCVEMYGTCTPPPEKLCTTSALYVDCGKQAQVPSSTDWVNCVCP